MILINDKMMDLSNSQKALVSDLVMAMIYAGYCWHKTTDFCLEESDKDILAQLQNNSGYEKRWQIYKELYSSNLGFWEKRKLEKFCAQEFCIWKSEIIIGCYSQIRINRNECETHYVDGIKYSDFEKNAYECDFKIDIEAPFNGFDIGGKKRLRGEVYSCHTYVNYGSNLPLCPNCEGDGYLRCKHCGGSGLGRLEQVGNYKGGEVKLKRAQCTYCYGQGKVQCSVCHGSGKVNLRSEKYQELQLFEEVQTVQNIVLVKMPFSNDLIQLQSENMNEMNQQVILLRKSIHNVISDKRKHVLDECKNVLDKQLLDLFYRIVYDEKESIIAYSSEAYLKVPIVSIINVSSKGQHPIYAIENYKKRNNTYESVTTFITKPLK